ncbi:MAG: ABC transporter permease [Vicinamibacterales bacterium]
MTQDFKYAIRSLSRTPIFAAAAIGTLALGIGVNTTIFTLASNALLRPMPAIASPVELMWVSGLWRTTGRTVGMSYPEYLDFRTRSTEVFSDLLAFSPASFSLGSGGDPQRIRGHLVSGSYFATLGVAPGIGRTLQPSDDQPGAPPVAVISGRLWRHRFAGRIPDRPIVINGRDVTVVGVAPDGFVGPELTQSADIWMAISALPVLNTSQATWLTARIPWWLRVMGRRRPAISVQQAQSVVSGIAAALEAEHPDTNTDRAAVVSSASSGMRPSERGELLPIAALLLTVTGLVLLIACANVSNLLLARGAARSMEMSIRAAVGASRWRIVRQLLAESLVLSFAGASGGLLLSFWAADLLAARLPELDFGGLTGSVDARVLLFTSALALISACIFGLTPALSVSRGALLPRLRETTAAGGRSRTQAFFVVTELSLSLVLLVGAGLSVRAVQKAAAIDLGFNTERLLTASYDLALQNYPVERRDMFRRDLTSRIRTLPGVESVALADLPPLSGTMMSTMLTATDADGHKLETRAYMSSVGADYFRTMGIPVLRGRSIDDGDRRGSPGVALVNETLARRLWPHMDPLGRTLQVDDRQVQVVGVARDAKYDEPVEDPRSFIYLSLAQHSSIDRETIIVRSSLTSMTTGHVLREQIHALDPALPVFDVKSFDDVLRGRADKQRGISALFAAFGGLALALASLGLYGVMSYAVTRRTHEIGVRLALGATPRQLIRLIARDGLKLSLAGIGVGTILAYPLARALGALIFGVQIADLATFAAMCGMLIVVAMAAALLPARRAAHLDPLAALRTE